MSIAAGYHTPSTQNSTPRCSTARIGSVTGRVAGAVVSVVTGGHSFRGTRRAVAEPVPSGDTSLGETGGVDPTTLTFRPRSGRWMTGVVAALALYGIGSLAVAGEPLALVRYAPGLLLVTAVVWAAYWQPAVIVSDAGVTVRNVLRTVELPWPSIQRIDTRYALTLITAYGSYAAWAAPAPGRTRSREASAADLRGLPESTYGAAGSVRPGDLPTSPSGEAAAIVRRRWEALRDAGHLDDPRLERDRPRSHLHWGTLALLAALVALTVAALAGIHQR